MRDVCVCVCGANFVVVVDMHEGVEKVVLVRAQKRVMWNIHTTASTSRPCSAAPTEPVSFALILFLDISLAILRV